MNLPPLTKLSAVTAAVHAVTAATNQAQTPVPESSPGQLVDALHTAFGNHHARAVHAKGIILEGTFIPDAAAASLTTAPHLQKQGSEVVVRFSDFTGIPDIPDNIGPANPRGLAIKFRLPDGTATDIIAHSFNGFPTANSDQFRALLLAIGASGPDAQKPTALDTFLASHPLAKTFLSTQKLPASFATIAYFGVNAFQFTNKEGQACFIRYQFIPEDEVLLTPEQFGKKAANYLMDEIAQRIKLMPVRFKLYAQIAEAGDAIENPSVAWPEARKKVLLGVIEIKSMASNSEQEDKALSFLPNNIPHGIKTADPMLDFRSMAYPISVKERQ